ncbi:MAG TPA: site-2 protease family protein, partial [Tepidiformaceae bacterium]|nr:site-2 protease family protein [Tepidiformaceae bacterium]
MALASALAFFACVIAHELAHSVVAKLYKIPVKSITLFVFGGVAQITREATRPFAEFLMAVAGPLMSLVLGGVFFAVWWLLGENDTPADYVLLWLAVMNGALGIFNLIPAFPMDGGRVFRSLIWMVSGNYNRATTIAGWTGRGFGWAMIATGALAVAGVETYVASEGLGGFWLVLIGFFLENAARQSLFQNKLIESLKGVRAREVMTTSMPTVDASVNLRSLANVFDLNPRICYFVEEEGRLAGIVTAFQMAEVPEQFWNERTAGEAMMPSKRLRATDPERPLNEVLIEMETEDLTHMPVVEGGRVVGVLARERILAFLRQRGLLPAR